jgi:hypothetical protein
VAKRISSDSSYLNRQFDAKIMVLCVRWYPAYKLSYRDLTAMVEDYLHELTTFPNSKHSDQVDSTPSGAALDR